eukprot:gene6979-7620_t
MEQWSVENVNSWLHAHGFSTFVETFQNNDINGLALKELTREALEELEVPEDLQNALISKRDEDLCIAAEHIPMQSVRRKKRRQFKRPSDEHVNETEPSYEHKIKSDSNDSPRENSQANTSVRDSEKVEANNILEETSEERNDSDSSSIKAPRRRRKFKSSEESFDNPNLAQDSVTASSPASDAGNTITMEPKTCEVQTESIHGLSAEEIASRTETTNPQKARAPSRPPPPVSSASVAKGRSKDDIADVSNEVSENSGDRPEKPCRMAKHDSFRMAKAEGASFSDVSQVEISQPNVNSTSSVIKRGLLGQKSHRDNTRPEITIVSAKPIAGDFKKLSDTNFGSMDKKQSFKSDKSSTVSQNESSDSDDDGNICPISPHPKEDMPQSSPLPNERRLLILQRVKNGEITPDQAAAIIAEEEKKLAEEQAVSTQSMEGKKSPFGLLKGIGKASATGFSKFAQRVGKVTQRTVNTFTHIELPPVTFETSVLRNQKKDFGFLISAGGAPPIINSITYPELCPGVKLGDVVHFINDIDCHFMAGLKAREVLDKTPVGFKANLVLRRRAPDGDETNSTSKASAKPKPKPVPRSSSKHSSSTSSDGTSSNKELTETPAHSSIERPETPPRRKSTTNSSADTKGDRPVPAPRNVAK